MESGDDLHYLFLLVLLFDYILLLPLHPTLPFFSFSCSHFFLFLLIKRFFFINFVNLSTLFTPFFDFDYGFWFLVPWLWHFFFWRVRWWDGMENGIERLVITPLTASLSGCLRRAVCMYVDSLHSTCSRDW